MSFWTWVRVTLLVVAIAAVVGAGVVIYADWTAPSHVTIGPAGSSQIVVSIDGAVATPGVVALPGGARLQDLLEAAGGLAADADVTGLNLAARLVDGERVTIPRLAVAPTAINSNGTPVAPGPHLIDINTAPVWELDQLPGIGPVIAQRIVDYRDQHGPFRTIDDLDEVEGISPEMVDELRPLVTTGG